MSRGGVSWGAPVLPPPPPGETPEQAEEREALDAAWLERVRGMVDRAILEGYDAPMPWCEACGSYHAEPRDAAHRAELGCRVGEGDQ